MESAIQHAADDLQRVDQRKLLRTLLLLMLAFAAAIGVVNFVLLKSPLVAAFDLATFLLAAVLLPWERRTRRLRGACWATVAGLAVIILCYIIATDAADYAVLWLTVPPPLAFYLLGSRAGGWLAGAFSATAVLWLTVSYRHLSASPPSLLAVLNGLEVLLAHWLLFRFSERNREQAYERLRQLSRVDALTRVINRATFEQELRGALALAQRSGTPTALLFLDLDHFKRINDTRGHAVGDAVLATVARALEERVRASDRVGRWGGEEFLVLCPDTDETGAGGLAETLRSAIAALPQEGGFRVTVSIGVAVSPAGAEPAESLVSRADAALYRAKAAGRDRVVLSPMPDRDNARPAR